MPDISKCTNRICPKRATCYRYIAIPNEFMQSYANFDGSTCYTMVETRDKVLTGEAADAKLLEGN